jgi:hypothetical protein
MQQRQLRLGDILDDYCPRERRLTNHAVVAMVGPDVKQTRCTTCDAEHEYKHAKVPRQRRKNGAAALAQSVPAAPKRVAHEVRHDAENGDLPETPNVLETRDVASDVEPPESEVPQPRRDVESSSHIEEFFVKAARSASGEDDEPDVDAVSLTDESPDDDDQTVEREEGPVHRPLIRASLPRPEGQPPPTRPTPEFTIRQPGGRQNRFRPRHQRGGQPFQGRSNGNLPAGPFRGGAPRQGGRPPASPRLAKSFGGGRKRSK